MLESLFQNFKKTALQLWQKRWYILYLRIKFARLFVCGLYQKIIVIDKINEHFETTCFSSVARHQLDLKVIRFFVACLLCI